jgi:hypothetical protein
MSFKKFMDGIGWVLSGVVFIVVVWGGSLSMAGVSFDHWSEVAFVVGVFAGTVALGFAIYGYFWLRSELDGWWYRFKKRRSE